MIQTSKRKKIVVLLISGLLMLILAGTAYANGSYEVGWWDIGSGGGFPAIPLALVFEELEAVMVERSRKKAGFLQNAVSELGLSTRVAVRQEDFPREGTLEGPKSWVITARAVEKPERVWHGIQKLVEQGAVFLCQWAEVPKVALETFHVEHIIDDWSKNGLRRGELHVIRPR